MSVFLRKSLRALAGIVTLAALVAAYGGAAAARAGDLLSSCGATGPCAGGPNTDLFWIRGEYLLWQLTGSDLPPLVTASPANTPLADVGVLGESTTTILSGNETVSDGYRSGFAISGGYWLDPCRGLALTGDYFNAGRDSYNFSAGPDSTVALARPFFDSQASAASAELVDYPNQLNGNVRVSGYEDFQGAGGAVLRNVWCCNQSCGCEQRGTRLDVLAGYRYYQHDSALAIGEALVVLSGTTTPLIPGTQFNIVDRFRARNEFHGGEIGLQGRFDRNDVWLDGLATLAIGGMQRVVNVEGSTAVTVPSVGTAVSQGGLLTSSETNLGRYRDTKAAVIPRFRLGAGCQLTQIVSARLGYSVIIWDEVAQAAAHLPPGLAVDPRNLPPITAGGGANPAFPGIQGNTVVAHGLDFALQLDF